VNTDIAVAAAIAAALCNGVAAVPQKVSANKAKLIKSLDPSVLVKLLKQSPYLFGIILDILAGFLTLVAVHSLPLFIVQAVIASGVVITAFIERIVFRRKLPGQIYLATVLVLIGLSMLALASHNENAASISSSIQMFVGFFPFVLIILGAPFIKSKSRFSSTALALLSGIGFGGVSVIGRIIIYPNPIWQVITMPLIYSLAAYAVIGMLFFTAALQRTLATSVNGLMVASQTIFPLSVGILLLGDTAKNNLWVLVYSGCLATVAGCMYISFASSKITR
jgi:drug/metabolite transporter (DMT)-like permease